MKKQEFKDTLIDFLLLSPMKKWGANHPITIYDNREYSYKDYTDSVNVISKIFSTKNLDRQIVGIVLDDSYLCICCFLSLINIGAIPLIISPKTNNEVLKKITAKAMCSFLITDTIEIITTNASVVNIKFVSTTKFDCNYVNRVYSQPHINRDDELTYLTLTSGSDGIPKLVKHSTYEMQAATQLYAQNTLQITTKDVLFSIAKINFTYGLANSLFFSLATGAKAIIYSGVLSNEQIFSLLAQYKATCFFAVPSVYERILKNGNPRNEAFDSVRLFISAGEFLPNTLNKKWKDFSGKYIVDSVGCSETGSAYLVNFKPDVKGGSAGIPVEGYEVFLKDVDEGFLFVGGLSNALGYYRDEEEEKFKFTDGYINTGDCFRRDEDGYFWFMGRKDDMIKKNGHWVSLNELNDCMKQTPGVIKTASFRTENGKIISVIEIDETFMGVGRLLNELKSKLAHYKCPDRIEIIDNIPVNNNDKIDYCKLKDKYEK